MEHNYWDLNFFDCNTYIGRPAVPRYIPRAVGALDLVAEMDRIQVRRALVTHVNAKEYHPADGNPRAAAELGDRSRLAPVWVGMPHHTDEAPEPEEWLRAAFQAGVRCVRLLPSFRGNRYPLSNRHVAGELLSALNRHRVPVLLDYNLNRRDDIDWRELCEVMDSHPEIPIILIRAGARVNRTLYSLFKAYPNLHIETAGAWVHRGIEDVVHRFGPERMVFGSGYPYHPLGGAAFHVAHAQLSQEEKRLVAGGNLERMLADVRVEL